MWPLERGTQVLHPWSTFPLGRTLKLLLFLLLAVCTEFARHLEGSRAVLAADKYYMSPLLLLCLAHHTIFELGAVKSNKNGIPGLSPGRRRTSLSRTKGTADSLALRNPGGSPPSCTPGTPKTSFSYVTSISSRRTWRICPTDTCQAKHLKFYL